MLLVHTTTSGSSSYATHLRELLDSAEASVQIMAHRIDARFVSMFHPQWRRYAERRIVLRLLLSTAHLDAAAATLHDLRKAAPHAEIRVAANLHAKAVIVDRVRLMLGSANLSGDSLGVGSERDDGIHHWNRPNFELGVLVEDAALSQEAEHLFLSHWELAQPWM